MGLTGIISKLSNLLSNQPSSATGTSENNTTPTVLADSSIQSMVQMFKLVSDGTRLRILFLLGKEKEINVRTLCELLQQSQPAVSHHLGLLRVAGLIACRRDGKHNYLNHLPRCWRMLERACLTSELMTLGKWLDQNVSLNYREINHFGSKVKR